MNIFEIREYLEKKYMKIAPFPSLLVLNNYDGYEVTKEICNELISDMYVIKGLTYVTLEKEDPDFDNPNILKVFSYTRGLEISAPQIIDELIKVKYGKRMRFFGAKDSLNTTLGWQSPGVWTTGVQFLQYELDNGLVDDVVIEKAIEFSEIFAKKVGSITIQDFLNLKTGLKIPTHVMKEVICNLHARHFELSVQELLHLKFDYVDVITRYKPPYLKGKEIDVYARKGSVGDNKEVTICECKLKFGNQQINIDEVTKFLKIVSKIKQHETEVKTKEGGLVKIIPWLITNSVASIDALNLLKQNKISLKIAKLSSNWIMRADWKIEKLSEQE